MTAHGAPCARATRAVVIINPISGPERRRSIEASAALARDVLGRHGLSVDVQVTRARGDARTFSHRARAEGAGLVVAWGGDGTINEVAGALAFSEVVLGIVPGGSGNGLARDLGIPLDPGGALDVAATGQPRRIDGGQIDTALFFNVAGVGLDALIAQHIAEPRAQRGLAGYARLTLLELPRYRAARYGLEYDGRSEARDALFIAFANSRQYGNNARIAPAARLDDGELDLVVVEPQPLWRLVARMPDLFRGRLQAGTGLVMRTVTSVRVSGPAPLRYHADGEPGIGGPSIEVRVHAGALWVMTPVNN